jgi:hypothetical protein
MSRLDAEASSFATERAALPRFVAQLYDAQRLDGFGLGDVLAPGPLPQAAPPPFAVEADVAEVLLPKALQALELARQDEDLWTSKLRSE